jgi:hypothetical protein
MSSSKMDVKIEQPDSELEQFKVFMGPCMKYTPNNNYTILRQCLWIWIFLSQFKTITYEPKLKGNSANAKFCQLYCSRGQRDNAIFAKFQIADLGDDMIIDNINGFIIIELFNNGETIQYKKYFMEYIDSCRTCLKTTTTINSDNNPVYDYEFPIQDLNPSVVTNELCYGNKSYVYVDNHPVFDSSLNVLCNLLHPGES